MADQKPPDESPAEPTPPAPDAVHVLRLEPIRYRMGPLGTWRHGRAFQIAADASRNSEGSLQSVTGFLYCRAIELALKAYLIARGGGVNSAREFGHDLDRLLVEADARGLDTLVRLTGMEKRLVIEASDLYAENKLGYFDLFYVLTGPRLSLDELALIASRLLDALYRPCLEAGDEEYWSPLPPRR